MIYVISYKQTFFDHQGVGKYKKTKNLCPTLINEIKNTSLDFSGPPYLDQKKCLGVEE